MGFEMKDNPGARRRFEEVKTEEGVRAVANELFKETLQEVKELFERIDDEPRGVIDFVEKFSNLVRSILAVLGYLGMTSSGEKALEVCKMVSFLGEVFEDMVGHCKTSVVVLLGSREGLEAKLKSIVEDGKEEKMKGEVDEQKSGLKGE